MSPMRYPLAQEIYYQRALYLLVSQMTKLVQKHLLPNVRQWAGEATAKHLPTGPIRQDAWSDELALAVQEVLDDMQEPIADTIARLDKIFAGTMDFNYQEWKRLIRSQYGVNPVANDPERFHRLLQDWSEENSSLITDIPDKTMGEISELTQEALMSGQTVEDTTAAIYETMSERVDVSLSRARLIARDQVAKLNGDFTRQRQEDIGVEGYIWRTVGDERVRPTHEEVDGRYFDWANPPAETDDNHPGQDYQCRCWAEPVLPERMAFEATLVDQEEAA